MKSYKQTRFTKQSSNSSKKIYTGLNNFQLPAMISANQTIQPLMVPRLVNVSRQKIIDTIMTDFPEHFKKQTVSDTKTDECADSKMKLLASPSRVIVNSALSRRAYQAYISTGAIGANILTAHIFNQMILASASQTYMPADISSMFLSQTKDTVHPMDTDPPYEDTLVSDPVMSDTGIAASGTCLPVESLKVNIRSSVIDVIIKKWHAYFELQREQVLYTKNAKLRKVPILQQVYKETQIHNQVANLVMEITNAIIALDVPKAELPANSILFDLIAPFKALDALQQRVGYANETLYATFYREDDFTSVEDSQSNRTMTFATEVIELFHQDQSTLNADLVLRNDVVGNHAKIQNFDTVHVHQLLKKTMVGNEAYALFIFSMLVGFNMAHYRTSISEEFTQIEEGMGYADLFLQAPVIQEVPEDVEMPEENKGPEQVAQAEGSVMDISASIVALASPLKQAASVALLEVGASARSLGPHPAFTVSIRKYQKSELLQLCTKYSASMAWHINAGYQSLSQTTTCNFKLPTLVDVSGRTLNTRQVDFQGGNFSSSESNQFSVNEAKLTDTTYQDLARFCSVAPCVLRIEYDYAQLLADLQSQTNPGQMDSDTDKLLALAFESITKTGKFSKEVLEKFSNLAGPRDVYLMPQLNMMDLISSSELLRNSAVDPSVLVEGSPFEFVIQDADTPGARKKVVEMLISYLDQVTAQHSPLIVQVDTPSYKIQKFKYVSSVTVLSLGIQRESTCIAWRQPELVPFTNDQVSASRAYADSADRIIKSQLSFDMSGSVYIETLMRKFKSHLHEVALDPRAAADRYLKRYESADEFIALVRNNKRVGYFDYRLAKVGSSFRPLPRWSVSWYGTFIRRFITPGQTLINLTRQRPPEQYSVISQGNYQRKADNLKQMAVSDFRLFVTSNYSLNEISDLKTYWLDPRGKASKLQMVINQKTFRDMQAYLRGQSNRQNQLWIKPYFSTIMRHRQYTQTAMLVQKLIYEFLIEQHQEYFFGAPLVQMFPILGNIQPSIIGQPNLVVPQTVFQSVLENRNKMTQWLQTIQAHSTWFKDILGAASKTERINLWNDPKFVPSYLNVDKIANLNNKWDRVRYYHLILTTIQMLSTVRNDAKYAASQDSVFYKLKDKFKTSPVASKWELSYLSTVIDMMQDQFSLYSKSLKSHLKLYSYTPFAVEGYLQIACSFFYDVSTIEETHTKTGWSTLIADLLPGSYQVLVPFCPAVTNSYEQFYNRLVAKCKLQPTLDQVPQSLSPMHVKLKNPKLPAIITIIEQTFVKDDYRDFLLAQLPIFFARAKQNQSEFARSFQEYTSSEFDRISADLPSMTLSDRTTEMYLCDPEAIHSAFMVWLLGQPSKTAAQEYVAKYSKNLISSDMGLFIQPQKVSFPEQVGTIKLIPATIFDRLAILIEHVMIRSNAQIQVLPATIVQFGNLTRDVGFQFLSLFEPLFIHYELCQTRGVKDSDLYMTLMSMISYAREMYMQCMNLTAHVHLTCKTVEVKTALLLVIEQFSQNFQVVSEAMMKIPRDQTPMYIQTKQQVKHERELQQQHYAAASKVISSYQEADMVHYAAQSKRQRLDNDDAA